MYKEIKELVKAKEGYFRINHISVLRRWTEDAMGQKVDMLVLDFDAINGVNYSKRVGIISRDYVGIQTECEEATRKFMEEVTEKLVSNIICGYVTRGRR